MPRNHGTRQVLKRWAGAELEVADPAMFVGRRRELQAALRALAPGETAGVLLHGIGWLGKSSLAARIDSRLGDLRLAVVWGGYEALDVLDALAEALADHPPARTLLDARRAAVRADPAALEDVLVDLLAGPCCQAGEGRPVLLLIDELDRILEAGPAGTRHRVRAADLPTLRAVLRAFDPERSDSRLVVTSRFRFSLMAGGEDLADRLIRIQLPPFSEVTQLRLGRRQLAAARRRKADALDDAEMPKRLPLLARARKIARGNPGLQDLLGERLALALALAVPAARVADVLDEVERYLAGGDPPAAAEVQALPRTLAVDDLMAQAGRLGRALLSAVGCFELPVPQPVLKALAGTLGGDIGRLRDLGLLDPFEDVVDPRLTALAVNALAAGRVPPLTEAERRDVAPVALPPLIAAWGGLTGGQRRQAAAATTLTRLGVLAEDAAVVAACAADAVCALLQREAGPAAALGRAAIELLERQGCAAPLSLVACTAEALRTTGQGAAAGAVLAAGEAQLATAAAEPDPAQLTTFLFALGDYQAATGQWDAAQTTFQCLCAAEQARGNEYQAVLARGRIADILHARGAFDAALRIRREQELPVYARLGDARALAVTQGRIADILQVRGAFEGALAIRRNEQLPVYTRLGDRRAIAVTQGKIADILQVRGAFDEALAIRRGQELPVYAELGDVRAVAVTQGKIADILQAHGQLDEALAIRRERELPVYADLGDVRELALTQGRIANILQYRGELDEARRLLLEEVLPVFVRIGDVPSIAATQGQIADILESRGEIDEALRIRREQELPVYISLGDVRAVADTQRRIADILQGGGKIDEALRLLREAALPTFTRLDDVRSVAVIQGRIADILQGRGEIDEALRILREDVLPVYVRLGDSRAVAVTQGQVADILQGRGEIDEALAIHRDQALPVFAALPDDREWAITQGRIVDILRLRGGLDDALRICRNDMLPVFTRLGDTQLAAMTRIKVADILQLRGEIDEALRIHREDVLPVYAHLGDVRGVAVTEGRIAEILLARGQLDEAMRIRQAQIRVFSELGDVRAVAVTRGRIADIRQAQGDLDEALRIHREDAMPVFTELGDVRSIAVTKGKIADILARQGDPEAALALQRELLEANRRLNDADGIATSLWDIAQLELAQGRVEAAAPRLAEAWPIVCRIGNPDRIAMVGPRYSEVLAARGDTTTADEVKRLGAAAIDRIGQPSPQSQARPPKNQEMPRDWPSRRAPLRERFDEPPRPAAASPDASPRRSPDIGDANGRGDGIGQVPAPPPQPAPPPPAGDPVDAAVFCPPRVARDSVFLVQVYLYPPPAEADVEAMAQACDSAMRLGKYALPIDVPRGTRIDVRLEMPLLAIDEPDAVLVWRGVPTAAQFEVSVPAGAAAPHAIGRVRFAIGGVPTGTLRFQVALADAGTAPEPAVPREAQGARYRRAFVSYSAQDRAEVLRRVQAFRIAGMSVFLDILDLDPGDRWAKALYHEIDSCDVFLLFWSQAAAASEWVAREIDYALARQGDNADNPPVIQPVPIEGPPIAPPPPRLAGLHFNDALLAHIAVAPRSRGAV